MRRYNLVHIFKSGTQKEDTQKYGNSGNVYGEIMSGNGKQGHNIKSNDLPVENQINFDQLMSIMNVIKKDEEGVDCDYVNVDFVIEKLVNKR